MPENNSFTDLAAGRFRSLTGLTDKALRLYAERGILTPTAVDPSTGYRLYAVEQLRDGVVLDLLRRAKIPLDDLDADNRFRFDDHRGRIAMHRAMEDFSLAVAERVAEGDASALIPRLSEVAASHWIAVEAPFGSASSPEDAEETFTSMAVDLPHLDRVLLDALEAAGIAVAEESWTTSTEGPAARLRLAHRVHDRVPEDSVRRIENAVRSRTDTSVRVTSGTLPARQELVYEAPDDAATDDTGLADTALSYLAAIAFARLVAGDDAEALSDAARRRVFSVSMFDPSATPEDVYDLAAPR